MSKTQNAEKAKWTFGIVGKFLFRLTSSAGKYNFRLILTVSTSFSPENPPNKVKEQINASTTVQWNILSPKQNAFSYNKYPMNNIQSKC